MSLAKTLSASTTCVVLCLGVTVLPAATTMAAETRATATVTPNPWYANGPFKGWGTSLAWFANATGSYGEAGSISRSSGDAQTDEKALEYGKELRSDFYESIFGSDGLNLNMARYNIGGGNASDVAYGYPFMRQGAAVPGTWADDPDGSAGIYGGIGTNQSDKASLGAAFDPTNDKQYDWSKSKAQEWWVQQGAKTGDITHWEAFANSAPWFMTESGYATGGFNANANNLNDPEKFAEYMAKNVIHLETQYGINIDTVEPLNESETGYWSTPAKMASDYQSGNDANATLINRYVSRQYQDKNLSATPYTTDLKKPQEGMHVSSSVQIPLINALHASLADNPGTVVSATDASVQSQFVNSYKQWVANDPTIITQNKVGQYNVHSYGADAPRQVRDIAQSDGKVLSMSEVDGSWQSGGFNPFGFDNALGITGKINSDIYNLQSQDWTFWQVVEDLYNMQEGSTDDEGNTLNPAGENTNWGTVLIDFDCTVAGTDGKLYSQRRVDNNNGSTQGISPCRVLVNAKYNGIRAYTQFVGEGDNVIANSSQNDNFTAQSADGKVQTVIHTNNTARDQQFTVDLSNYAHIADDATGTLYLTRASSDEDIAKGEQYATSEILNKTSNIKQSHDAVTIDAEKNTATLTVPAHSIASLQLRGVTGVADDAAAVKDGESYQIIGKHSAKALSAVSTGDSALSLRETASNAQEAGTQIWKFTAIDTSAGSRPNLRSYVLQNADGKVLISNNGTNALSDMTLQSALGDPRATWILNTENGREWSLTNSAAQQSLDVDGQKTDSGTKVGLWTSSGSDSQAWTFSSTQPKGVRTPTIQTPISVVPQLPDTVTPYYSWGEGTPVSVRWDDAAVRRAVNTAGSHRITGEARDIFGNEIQAILVVAVGAFTVSDPSSLTVASGTAASEVESKAPATVTAHVLDSPGTPTPVTWDFSGLDDAKLSTVGTLTITGVAQNGAGGTIPAVLHVFVTTPQISDGDNLAQIFCSQAIASYTEGTNTAAKSCDGNINTAWSNWKNGGGDNAPSLQYTFDTPRKLNSLALVSYGEATAKSFSVHYLDATDNTWKDSGISASTGININRGDTTTVDLSALPLTAGIRLSFTYADNANYYTKVAEVRILESSSAPSPAHVADLADIRLNGVPLSGFDPAVVTYDSALAGDASSYPQLTAYAKDSAATVNIEQADAGNGGKATITVTAADNSTQRIYSVNFGVMPKLTGLKVDTAKTHYAKGEALDIHKLNISAVYTKNGETSATTTLDPSDPRISITGFDSSSSGKHVVTVRFTDNGVRVESSIEIIVDDDAQPSPAPSEPSNQANPSNPADSSASTSGTSGTKHLALARTGTNTALIAVTAAALAIAAVTMLIALRRRR
jgi:galactan exo-1,6-beta-galactobiohydrolase (non-reducing end)